LDVGTKITFHIKVGVSPEDRGLTQMEHASYLEEASHLGDIDKKYIAMKEEAEECVRLDTIE
jgi:hypothetical protein